MSSKRLKYNKEAVKVMTALRREAMQLVEQMPEDQMPYVIQYIRTLKNKIPGIEQLSSDEVTVTPKMRAFLELEKC